MFLKLEEKNNDVKPVLLAIDYFGQLRNPSTLKNLRE